jgi:GT2 family glycosyltransferase
MDLSILLVNWNTRGLLRGCLQSLRTTADRLVEATLIFGPYTAEVIVIDNASHDGSADMVRAEFPWARLIENERNLGFAPANNQAYQRCAGDYVLLLNSDTEVHPDAIRHLMHFTASHADCGGAGAQLLNTDGTLQPSCHPMLTPGREFWRLMFLDRLWRRSTYAMTHWDRDVPRVVETIKGACLIVRRAALDPNTPLLDEQYFMYTEEVDLCYRLGQAGWKLYWVPQARVTHFGEASSRQAYTQMYVQLYRSKVQFYRKFGGEMRAWRFKQLLRLAYWPRWLVARTGQSIRPSLSDRASTFRQLLAELPKM